MIRYKLVDRQRGSITLSNLDSFYTKYKKGAIMEDTKGMGYFLFRTKKEAKKYISSSNRILRVKLLDTEFIPKRIAVVYDPGILYKFYLDEEVQGMRPPEGTICCKKIKVLD